MRCPSCQYDVPEGHFYCPSCQTLISSYAPASKESGRGRIERAAKRLLDLALLLVLVGAGVLLARAINWKEVFNGFKPLVENAPSAGTNRDSSGASSSRKHSSKVSNKPEEKNNESSKQSGSAESVRDLKQKIEELPADEPRPNVKPSATPTPKPASN